MHTAARCACSKPSNVFWLLHLLVGQASIQSALLLIYQHDVTGAREVLLTMLMP
jgi:hypothetical protein